jgi:hypothetical protein
MKEHLPEQLLVFEQILFECPDDEATDELDVSP